MVDCSLDDYIGQKRTFSVQLNMKNVKFGNNIRGRGGFQRNNIRGGFQQNKTRGAFQRNTVTQGGFQRNTVTQGGFQRNTVTRGGFQKTLNRGNFNGNTSNKPNTNFAVMSVGNVKTFDARLRLGPKVSFDARQKLQQKKLVDARQKIMGFGTNTVKLNSGANTQNTLGPDFQFIKVNPPGATNTVNQVNKPFKKIIASENDARNKLLKIKIQKGTFDARSLISSKGGKMESSTLSGPHVSVATFGDVKPVTQNILVNSSNFDQGTGLLTKTVTNVTSDGSCIKMTDSGLQVTRSIPSSSITFDGSSVTVTKRVEAIETSDPKPTTNKSTIINFSQYRSYLGEAADTVGKGDDDDDDNNDDDDVNGFEGKNLSPMTMNITRTANFMKPETISPAVSKKTVTQSAGSQLKRKSVLPVSSGPLKLLKTGSDTYTPTVRVPSISKPAVTSVKPVVKKQTKPVVKVESDLGQDDDSVADIVNPLQGYRVYVTNLHPIVNQDDIIELFGAIGALKKAKLLKQGIAEVVYLNKEDAQKAVVKYNNRELDGQVMKVKLLTSSPTPVKKTAAPAPSPSPVTEPVGGDEASPAVPKSGPLKLRKQVPVSSLGPEPSNIQLPVLHKALFKLGAASTSSPVTFTVKI